MNNSIQPIGSYKPFSINPIRITFTSLSCVVIGVIRQKGKRSYVEYALKTQENPNSEKFVNLSM